MASPRRSSISLVKLTEMKVIAPTSSFAYKGEDTEIAEIAPALEGRTRA